MLKYDGFRAIDLASTLHLKLEGKQTCSTRVGYPEMALVGQVTENSKSIPRFSPTHLSSTAKKDRR
jgi:hypothetical protein